MSGRGKRQLYTAAIVVAALLCGAGTALIAWFGGAFASPAGYAVFFSAIALFLIFPPEILVHECGHLLFGACAGMRAFSVTLGRIRIARRNKRTTVSFAGVSPVAGAIEMTPRGTRRIRSRFLISTLGGAVCNLLYGAVFLTLFFVLPRHPALLFFELFAPIDLFEAFAALMPAELSAGKTDGAVALGLLRFDGESELTLRVLEAQAILLKGEFSDLPRELLFDTPVVREDSPAFLALTQLRWQFLLDRGETEAALRELSRLDSLSDYLEPSERAAVACDILFASCILAPDPERARRSLEAANGAGGCARLRALAAYGRDPDLIARARREAEREDFNGIRSLENKMLSMIVF